MYIIKDWANNTLDYTGKFKYPCLAVPMTFKTWDDAEDWLCENLKDYCDERQDLYIEEKTICKTY
jgi:hypothetical protein